MQCKTTAAGGDRIYKHTHMDNDAGKGKTTMHLIGYSGETGGIFNTGILLHTGCSSSGWMWKKFEIVFVKEEKQLRILSVEEVVLSSNFRLTGTHISTGLKGDLLSGWNGIDFEDSISWIL